MPTQQERRTATRQAVLDAAIAEFTSSSVAEASLDDIATRADLAKSTILYHFDSRAGVLQAVAVELIVRLETRLANTTELTSWLTEVLLEQTTATGRLLYGINDELTDHQALAAIDPMTYVSTRLDEFGAGPHAEVITAAAVHFGRMLARGLRTPAEVPHIVSQLTAIADNNS